MKRILTTVYATEDLTEYFAKRQSQNEQLVLKRLSVTGGWGGWNPSQRIIHFLFTVKRQVGDLNNSETRVVTDKGAIECQRQRFIVIRIGDAEIND